MIRYNTIKEGDFLLIPYPYDKEVRHQAVFILVKKPHYCVGLYDGKPCFYTKKEIETNFVREPIRTIEELIKHEKQNF